MNCRSVAPGINFGEYEDAIVTLSDGLPLLILMIGSELKNNDEMTPCHMVQCLQTSRLKTLSDTLYPKEDRICKKQRIKPFIFYQTLQTKMS
jgi:hypothetical protein